MDGLEKEGLANASKAANRKINLNTPITDNPELELIRQSLQRDYTAKTDEAAQARREAQQMMQQAQNLYNQVQHQQAQATPQGQQPSQQTKTPRNIIEHFEEKFGQEPQDAATRQTLAFLEEHFGGSGDGGAKELGELKREMEQMKALLQQSNHVVRALTAKPELDQLTGVLGEDEVRKRLPQVSEIMGNNPNMTLKQALAAADPDFFATQMGRFSAEEETKKQQDEQSRMMALLGGGVEGMNADPGGPGTSLPELDPGEGFADSVRKVIGEGGFRNMLQQGAMDSV